MAVSETHDLAPVAHAPMVAKPQSPEEVANANGEPEQVC